MARSEGGAGAGGGPDERGDRGLRGEGYGARATGRGLRGEGGIAKAARGRREGEGDSVVWRSRDGPTNARRSLRGACPEAGAAKSRCAKLFGGLFHTGG